MAGLAIEPPALYLPADRAQALRDERELHSDIGSVLLADLGGFTALTNSLVAELGSRRGAEVLINHLNSIYDTIVDEVHRYGGVVIDFSGDAVNCFFGSSGEHDPVERAATAALGMQRRLGWHEGGDVEQVDKVELKVAISTGPTQRLRLGHRDIRLFDVMTGPPVFEAARLEKLAEPGQIILDHASAVRLESSACGARVSSPEQGVFELHDLDVVVGASRVPAGELATVTANEWIDYKLRSESGARSAELRSVVTLFVQFWKADLVELSGRQDIDLEHLEKSVRTIQELVDQRGGSLIQLTVGDKGGYGLCTFGAPVAQKELADRALACALDLRAASTKASTGPEGWTIGIAQGVCRAGYYGSTTRRSYGVIGDCTNVSARLMIAGEPGQILVTDQVQAAWKRSVACSPQQLLTLAGQPQPVAASVVTGYRLPGDEGRSFANLSGRSAALSSLKTHVREVLDGSVETVFVTGETGLGKGHLIEAARLAILDESTLHWMGVTAEEANPRPMHLFLLLIERIFYQELVDDPTVRSELFEASFDGFLYEVRRGDPALAELLGPFRSSLAALLAHGFTASDVAFADAVDVLVLMVRAISVTRRLVLHISDGQWMDPDSKTILHALLATRAPRICVVVDTTTERGLAAQTPERHIGLKPLDERETIALAEEVLDGGVGKSIVDYLDDLAAGIPLYVDHVLVSLRDNGNLQLDWGGRWQLTAAPEEPLPESLTPIITAHLDRLPTTVKETVQMASVLGSTFAIEHLRAMHTVADRGDLDDQLVRAADHGIWTCDADHCTFTAALVRQAALALNLDSDAQSHEWLATNVTRPALDRDATTETVSLQIASERGAEKEAMDAVAALANRLHVDPARVHDLQTAVSEACINAMLHGNQMEADSSVLINVVVGEGTIVIDVVDENRMDVDADAINVHVPDIEAQIAGRQTPGGMGLYLISKLVDSAEFVSESTNVGTRFRMTVHLDAER